MFSSPGALSGATVAVLIVAFIASGSLLTLGAKLADITTSLGNEGTYHKFNHPLMQTWAMFVGETLCFMAYWICFHKLSDAIGADGADSESAQPKILSIGGEPASSAHTDSGLVAAAPTRPPAYSVWIFALPASLDLLASTLMGFALIFTYSSTYQMLRGSVVLFTALLSLLFLGRRLAGFQWTGLGILVTGLVLVGVSSVLAGVQRVQAPNPVLGNALIVCAQVIVAVQMVVEEHFLSKYQVPPMLFVGWEGVFGLAFSSALIVASYWIPGWSTGGRLEDALDAFVQIKNSPVIAACFFGSMVAVAFFNYFGLTITKYLTATTRTMVDSMRTVVIWTVALAVGWEKFQWLQPVGFTLLLLGFFFYFGTIPVPGCPKEKPKEDATEEDTQPLDPSNREKRT